MVPVPIVDSTSYKQIKKLRIWVRKKHRCHFGDLQTIIKTTTLYLLKNLIISSYVFSI